MRSVTNVRVAMVAVAFVVAMVMLIGWLTRPTSVDVVHGEPSPLVEAVNVGSGSEIQAAELLAQRQSAHWDFVTLVLTGFGLVVLVATLIETQIVGFHTRRIGEAQVRSYIGCEEAYLSLRPDNTIEVVLEMKNFGQSPAFFLRYEAEIFVENAEGRTLDRYQSPSGSEPSTLSADQQEERRIRWFRDGANGFLPEFVDLQFITRHPIIIQVYAKWIDVFDETQSMTFKFKSEKDRHFVVTDNGTSITKFNLMRSQDGISIPSSLG